MADVTGRVYEAFVEHLLRRLGYRDEWTNSAGSQYLYEKHPEALCHSGKGLCSHAADCHVLSSDVGLSYGPWYDPDFFLLEEGKPAACIHVSHWSSPSDSHRKFWRTAEDHLQYKVHFGAHFLSVNLVFVALEPGQTPKRITDSDELVMVQGFKPANGSVLAVAFDSTILFPQDYLPIEEFVALLPAKVPAGTRRKRQLYNDLWEHLNDTNKAVRRTVGVAVKLLRKSLNGPESPRYSPSVVTALQDVCWIGRQRARNLHPTETRYRKGLQHAFVIRELIARSLGTAVDGDAMLWSALAANPRFPNGNFRKVLNAGLTVRDSELEALIQLLGSIPVQMKKYEPIFLLNTKAGLNHAEWNADLKQFILGLRHLQPSDILLFQEAVRDLYAEYRNSYGIASVISDLCDPARIRRKVEYVRSKYLVLGDKTSFIDTLSNDMLTPGRLVPHQAVVQDVHNWPPDVLFEFYRLGSMQHITTALPRKFERKFGHSLRPYAYMNNLSQLVSHLMAGVAVGQFFSSGARLNESAFYDAIWPLFAECIWEAIGRRKPLDSEVVEVNHRYKKAKRIISSPDLEPIAFLFRRSMPLLADGPVLRGAFNQLSSVKGWGRAALTTATSGLDTQSGAILHTQSVIGAKHIADKTKELAARMRSIHLRCDASGNFRREPAPGSHFLVVDGDWPVESKLNLLEAGYSGIFEIAELDSLNEILRPANAKQQEEE